MYLPFFNIMLFLSMFCILNTWPLYITDSFPWLPVYFWCRDFKSGLIHIAKGNTFLFDTWVTLECSRIWSLKAGDNVHHRVHLPVDTGDLKGLERACRGKPVSSFVVVVVVLCIYSFIHFWTSFPSNIQLYQERTWLAADALFGWVMVC